MKYHLTFLWRTLSLGVVAYALVYFKDLPVVSADTIIDTDCSTNLDQPNTTYRLTANVPGSCLIVADNVILDGQNLYTISGSVNSTTTIPVDFTVQNVTVGGNVYNHALSGPVGGITASHVTMSSGYIHSKSDTHGLGGDVIVSDSSVHGVYTDYANISVANSTIGIDVRTLQHGNITVTDSTVSAGVVVYSSGDITVTNSTINGGGANTIYGTDYCTITDSTITPAVVHCPYSLNVTDNAPSLTVTPLTLSLEQGDSFNPFSGVSATDTKDGSLTGDVSVIGSVGTEPGTYPLVYSVTDHGTTLFNTFDSATTTVGPTTASTTRTVTRNGAATPTESESSTQATWVGHRSSGGGPTHTTDTASTTASTTPTTQSLDATLAELRTVLAQPITTTDTTKLAKLVDLLTKLLAVLVQLIAKGG